MQLKNKVICFLGDSITQGVGVSNITNRYDNLIKEKCGLKAVYNYGISGTRLAHQRVPSEKPRYDLCFCGRAYDLNPDADVIIVYGGVNDYIHGDAPFGCLEDKTQATFCGAVNFLMGILKELYPKATIVFLTPACFNEKISFVSKANKRKYSLKDYCDVIVKLAGHYNIPVLDLYNNLQIDLYNNDICYKYTTDGLHFNDEGHKVLADVIIQFLQNQ